jgi:hypothetical protein
MVENTEKLLVLDERGVLPREILNRLSQIGSTFVSHTMDEARDRIGGGACRAVLIAMSGTPFTTMSRAFCVHEMNPGLPVMVLGGDFKPRLTRLAARAGFHLIVNDGEVEFLMSSVTESQGTTIVFL